MRHLDITMITFEILPKCFPRSFTIPKSKLQRGNPTSLVRCLHFYFYFHSLVEFYIGEEGNESIIDHLERRRRIFVALALYWCLHMIVQHVLDMQTWALNGECCPNFKHLF